MSCPTCKECSKTFHLKKGLRMHYQRTGHNGTDKMPNSVRGRITNHSNIAPYGIAVPQMKNSTISLRTAIRLIRATAETLEENIFGEISKLEGR